MPGRRRRAPPPTRSWPLLGFSWAFPEPLLGSLGLSWALLASPVPLLASPGLLPAFPGLSWALLGSWAFPGLSRASPAVPGMVWRLSWPILGLFWSLLASPGLSWPPAAAAAAEAAAADLIGDRIGDLTGGRRRT